MLDLCVAQIGHSQLHRAGPLVNLPGPRHPRPLGARNCPLPICVGSNIDRADLDEAITRHSLLLSVRITSEDVRAHKPDAVSFQAALEALHRDVAEGLHVGDPLTSDVAGARATGIQIADSGPIHAGAARLPESVAAPRPGTATPYAGGEYPS